MLAVVGWEADFHSRMPRMGILDSLEHEQKDQLVTWMELYDIEQVLEKVAAPPPAGFNIKTHITSLRRFYRREKIRDAQENISLARAASLNPADLEIIREAASISLTQQAFNSATAPDLEGSHLPAAAKWLLALQEFELRREQLKIRREQLELEKKKLLIYAELKEVGILYAPGTRTLNEIARDVQKTG